MDVNAVSKTPRFINPNIPAAVLSGIYDSAAQYVVGVEYRPNHTMVQLQFRALPSYFANLDHVPTEIITSAMIQGGRCAAALKAQSGDLCSGSNMDWFLETRSLWRIIDLRILPRREIQVGPNSEITEIKFELSDLSPVRGMPAWNELHVKFQGSVRGQLRTFFPAHALPMQSEFATLRGPTDEKLRRSFDGKAPDTSR